MEMIDVEGKVKKKCEVTWANNVQESILDANFKASKFFDKCVILGGY